MGQPVIPARARLRFGPGRTCEPLARLLDRAVVQAESAGLDPALLIVADGSVQAGEDIVRMRRAYGVADWIQARPARCESPCTRPACTRPPPDPPDPPPTPRLRRAPGSRAPAPAPGSAEPPAPDPPLGGSRAPGSRAPGYRNDRPRGSRFRRRPGTAVREAAVREALSEVIDPDLGVNIVDLGFVRAITVAGQSAVITMTLTSAACPLTSVMESQIRTGLASVDGVEDSVSTGSGSRPGAPPTSPTRPRATAGHRLQPLKTPSRGKSLRPVASTTVAASHGRSHPASASSPSTSAAVIPQISIPLTRNAGSTIPLGRCIISRMPGSASSLTLIRSTAATSPGSTGATAHGEPPPGEYRDDLESGRRDEQLGQGAEDLNPVRVDAHFLGRLTQRRPGRPGVRGVDDPAGEPRLARVPPQARTGG